MNIRVERWMAIGLAILLAGGCHTPRAPRTGYVPAEEEGVMTAGLDDHDYDLMAAGLAREMFQRGLPRGYVVALGPVDTRDCPYDVRVVQFQKSLSVLFNKEGTLRFMSALDAITPGGTSAQEIYKLMQFNWLNRNPLDVEDLQTLGRLAQVNGILFGRVSTLERDLPGGGREVTYRFVWELANTVSGLLDIAHEEKIRKNVR